MSFLTWWYWPKYSNSFLTEPTYATIFQPHWNSQGAWPLASVLWFPGSPSIKLHLGFFIKFDIPKVATGGIKEFMHHLNFFLLEYSWFTMHLLVSAREQSESDIPVHTSILFWILSHIGHYRGLEQSSLCYTEGPCYLYYMCMLSCSLMSDSLPSHRL